MNKKANYATYIVLTGAVVSILGEYLPESFKTGVEGVFPIPLSISFEFAWVISVVAAVLLSIWLVRKYEKADIVQPIVDVKQKTTEHVVETKSTSDPKPIQAAENQALQSSILQTKATAKNMTKEQILSLIDDDIDKAFEALDSIFLGKNATYKDLAKEYFERPDSFSLATYRAKLKRFVSINWK